MASCDPPIPLLVNLVMFIAELKREDLESDLGQNPIFHLSQGNVTLTFLNQRLKCLYSFSIVLDFE